MPSDDRLSGLKLPSSPIARCPRDEVLHAWRVPAVCGRSLRSALLLQLVSTLDSAPPSIWPAAGPAPRLLLMPPLLPVSLPIPQAVGSASLITPPATSVPEDMRPALQGRVQPLKRRSGSNCLQFQLANRQARFWPPMKRTGTKPDRRLIDGSSWKSWACQTRSRSS